MKKATLSVGLLFIAIVLISIGFSTLSVFAEPQKSERGSAAISPEEDFDGKSVLVTMTEEISEVNKEYEPSFFNGVAISSIEDLTFMTGSSKDKKYFEEDNFKQILQLHLPIDSKQNVIETIEKLEEMEGVLSASPNYYAPLAEVPNDDFYNRLWGMSREDGINAVDAWDITTGSSTIKVGIIDTGIANHPDLNANLGEGWDFVNNNNITNDDPTGHGTHVAGTIGACGNNGIGVVGVNWNVTLVPLQVVYWDTDFSDWRLSGSGAISAISWAINNDIPILNYSAGTDEQFPALQAALEPYTGLFVCSAGNDASDNDTTAHYPSEYADETNNAYSNVSNQIISVGALNENGERRSSSNYGVNTVSIYAPGGSIYSTVPTDLIASGYDYKSGTSMAAPHVTGVAALLLSKDPALTGEELKEILIKTADEITISIPSGTQTVKKLNAGNAMDWFTHWAFYLFDGNGTDGDPFQIRTEEDFKNIGRAYREVYEQYMGTEKQINYSFMLMNDLYMQEDWVPFEYPFSGHFDGGGHTISYTMIITQEDLAYDYQGLFGFVIKGAEIKNLRLWDCRVNSAGSLAGLGDANVGLLAGAVYEAGKIESIKIEDSTVSTNIYDACTGGIAGSIYITPVENCELTDVYITSYDGAVGGMAGMGDIGYFRGGKCYATVTKNNYAEGDLVGPIVGNSQSTSTVDAQVTLNKEGSCVAAGTLITLADGTQKPVEELTGNERLLVWDLETGAFDTAPILFIDRDPARVYPVIELQFSDGTSVRVISEHGFWDVTLNEYVYLDKNASSYIGHWFVKHTAGAGGTNAAAHVQLTGVTIAEEYTAAYSPVTAGHLCYFVNGMLSVPGGIEGLFNIFEVDPDTMQYDAAAKATDIAEYGLYTYEEFAAKFPVSEEVFEAFNGQYLKVAVGKGLITEEEIVRLIERYAEFLPYGGFGKQRPAGSPRGGFARFLHRRGAQIGPAACGCA